MWFWASQFNILVVLFCVVDFSLLLGGKKTRVHIKLNILWKLLFTYLKSKLWPKRKTICKTTFALAYSRIIMLVLVNESKQSEEILANSKLWFVTVNLLLWEWQRRKKIRAIWKLFFIMFYKSVTNDIVMFQCCCFFCFIPGSLHYKYVFSRRSDLVFILFRVRCFFSLTRFMFYPLFFVRDCWFCYDWLTFHGWARKWCWKTFPVWLIQWSHSKQYIQSIHAAHIRHIRREQQNDKREKKRSHRVDFRIKLIFCMTKPHKRSW